MPYSPLLSASFGAALHTADALGADALGAESLTADSLTAAAAPAAPSLVAAAYVAFACASVILSIIDLRTHRLPNRIVLSATLAVSACLSGAAWLGSHGASLARSFAAAAALLAVYAALRALSRFTARGGSGAPAIGLGDVKLAPLVGLALGWTGWPTVLLGTAAAFIVAGLVAAMMLASGRATRRSRIAFGPCIFAGAWAALLPGLG